MSPKTRNWIIGIVILIIVIIIIYYFTTTNANANTTSNSGGSIASLPSDDFLENLSPQDLATYNSLPNAEAKADFIRILSQQGKIPTPTTQNGGIVNTTTNTV